MRDSNCDGDLDGGCRWRKPGKTVVGVVAVAADAEDNNYWRRRGRRDMIKHIVVESRASCWRRAVDAALGSSTSYRAG